jgi:hypothetical protein
MRKGRPRTRTLKELLIQVLRLAGKIAEDDIMPHPETGRSILNWIKG